MATVARLSVQDYNRIVETGVLDGRRIEFIDGRICEMTPIGSKHESAVDQLARWSFRSIDDSVLIRIQQSLGLPLLASVPEPDVAWVQNGDYTQTRPTADDVILLIEVADTSVDYDLGEKARLYSAAGIRDYWVVDCPRRRVVVHREPGESGYRSVGENSRREAISPLSHPDVSLLPETLFKPTNAKDDG